MFFRYYMNIQDEVPERHVDVMTHRFLGDCGRRRSTTGRTVWVPWLGVREPPPARLENASAPWWDPDTPRGLAPRSPCPAATPSASARERKAEGLRREPSRVLRLCAQGRPRAARDASLRHPRGTPSPWEARF